MEFSLSQLETRGLDLTCFFDSILETLSRVSFPVDGGTKHSGSRHASRRLRAALSLRMLESRFTRRVVQPERETLAGQEGSPLFGRQVRVRFKLIDDPPSTVSSKNIEI